MQIYYGVTKMKNWKKASAAIIAAGLITTSAGQVWANETEKAETANPEEINLQDTVETVEEETVSIEDLQVIASIVPPGYTANNIFALSKNLEKISNPNAKAAIQKNIDKALAEWAEKNEETEVPEVEVPEVETPEVEVPEVEAPETETPEVETPEVETPEVEVPETEVEDEKTAEEQAAKVAAKQAAALAKAEEKKAAAIARAEEKKAAAITRAEEKEAAAIARAEAKASKVKEGKE